MLLVARLPTEPTFILWTLGCDSKERRQSKKWGAHSLPIVGGTRDSCPWPSVPAPAAVSPWDFGERTPVACDTPSITDARSKCAFQDGCVPREERFRRDEIF